MNNDFVTDDSGYNSNSLFVGSNVGLHNTDQDPTEVTIKGLDSIIIVRGYRRNLVLSLLIWMLIILTAGLLGLILLYWRPDWMLKLTHSVCALTQAQLIYIEDSYQQRYVRKLYTTTSMTSGSMRQQSQLTMFMPFDKKPIGSKKQVSQGVFVLTEEGKVERVPSILWFQFQKHKYFWVNANVTFRPLVGPDTVLRTNTDTQRGLSDTEVVRRTMLFGKNELIVRVDSPFRILVLEALNPFYIFQVYSFIVWYTENYIYYAWCIVIMSALSLLYTTWQTSSLQRMRRDRFQTSGTVQVIRHHDTTNTESNGGLITENGVVDRRRSVNTLGLNDVGMTNYGANISDEETSSTLKTNHRLHQSYDAVETGWRDADNHDDVAQLPVSTVNVNEVNLKQRSVPSNHTTAKITNQYEQTVESSQLVPGDIIVIPSHGCEMHCDAILLTGTCLVNEATLTGESVPVSKAALDSHGGDSTADDPDAAAAAEPARLYYLSPTSSVEQRGAGGTSKNMLYAGTKIIQTRYYGSESVKAVVMRTGYCTVKGELVRSILYPKPVDFSFYRDAMRFLAVLGVFAVMGMIYTLIMLKMNGSENFRLVLRALDVVTIIVPPALPFALTMGIVHAQKRLRKAGLFCISPRMINMAGSINLVCFDKTGTLTDDGLSLRGVIPLASGGDFFRLSELVSAQALLAGGGHDNNNKNEEANKPDSFYDDTSSQHGAYRSYRTNTSVDADVHQLPPELRICMATCHELTLIDDKLTGDPLDLEMFRATGWELEEPDVNDTAKFDQFVPTVVRPRARVSVSNSSNSKADGTSSSDVSILRIMSFESKLQCMSVVIRRASLDERFWVCTKGAPEKIASLCVAESVPDNFNDVLTTYTQNGDRVLSLAYRPLPASTKITKISRLSRATLERDLQFLGFIVFENRLKPQSIPCIRELKSACIRSVMVTGDNLLTALSVARQCNIIDTKVVSLLDIVGEDRQQKLRRRVVPTGGADVDGGRVSSVEPAFASQISLGNASARRSSSTEQGYFCALTGDTFQALREKHVTEYYQTLQYGAVFARMTPAQKELLVEDLRHRGYFVGMCGDGANDCGALKAAHMGISLSDQEASAAAPYTYKHANVSCVPICIKEGRAALDTSFGAFKFMAGYSMTQFLSGLILIATNTYLSDFQFLYIDLFQVTLIVVVFGLSTAAPTLAKTPPPSRLIGIIPLLSLALQVLTVLGIQVAAYLLMVGQPWYVPTVDNHAPNVTLASVTTTTTAASVVLNTTLAANITTPEEPEHYFSYQNYAVVMVSTFQYVWLAMAFSRGIPYRRFILTNWLLTALCIILLAFNAFLVLKPCSWMIWLMEIKLPPTWHFRWIIIGLAVGSGFLALCFEWWLVPSLNNRLAQKKRFKKSIAAPMSAVEPVGFTASNDLTSGSEMEMDRIVQR